MVSSVIRLVDNERCTDQLVDRRSVGGRIPVAVPVERSLLGVHLPSGFDRQPASSFRRGRNGNS